METRLLRHCSRCAARRLITPIPLHHFLDYVLKMSIDKMKDNGFKLTKEKSRRYPSQTIMDMDYADDIALLANTPAQAKTLLHSLEWAAAGVGLYVNADKMEFMCFNWRGNISTLNGCSLKLVDKFIYHGSSVSSTETDINMWLAKAWIGIDRLSVIWKSDLTNKIKCRFFQAFFFCCWVLWHINLCRLFNAKSIFM